ncbi:M23 family metallopeptidase [Geitlerinema sp. PCC 9228]|jgi:murein DD-endopeptidase MepM/ murein hydrolase activator NlpD|uniref:M23 family metallopeptidase n=1 Tax=Geitlerinema sp. PCC 9228 TaxID=111611 RepID=UPI0008F989EC|nr:M23 family metallopeptidase [Geitlerinema sp. PCC 9228]
MDSQHSKNDRLFWWQQGLSWIGSIGILSSGMAIAVPEPSTQAADLLSQAESTSNVVANSKSPSPAIDTLPNPQGSTPSTPAARPKPQTPSATGSPTPIPPETAQVEPTLPDSTNQTDAPLVLPHPQQQGDRQLSYNNKNQYIDSSNDFNLGATTNQQQPAADNVQVVMEERSTGCERVVNKGDVVSGKFCPPPPTQPAAIARHPQPRYNRQPTTPRYRQTNAAIRNRQANRDRSVDKRTVVRHSYYGQQAWENIQNLKMPGNDNTSMLFPLSIPATITSVFGWRTHPIFGEERFHTGTDLGAPQGTPVVAALGGRVAQAGWIKGYGLTVILEHFDRHNQPQERTLYAHLSRLWVEAGDWVEQGSAIAQVGNTGYSTGPHLHFEWQQATSEGWQVVDPGDQLEYSLANLVRYFEDQVAQNRSDEAEAATESPTAG